MLLLRYPLLNSLWYNQKAGAVSELSHPLYKLNLNLSLSWMLFDLYRGVQPVCMVRHSGFLLIGRRFIEEFYICDDHLSNNDIFDTQAKIQITYICNYHVNIKHMNI